MAWKISTVCNDAHYYIYVADALEKGDFAQAFSYLNLNIYPLILVILHRSGLEWITAGQMWGVLISSLTVLPMYGWIQRVFDKRIAVTACLLYAVHPELIEVSIEPIRGPTFWFFMTLGLYLSYRAVTEVRMWLHVAAGISIALAIHTRSEGWLLFSPIVLWSCYRMSRFPNLRWKLSSGMATCLLMTPLLLVLVNVTLLRSHSQWEWGRLTQTPNSPINAGLQWFRTSWDFSKDTSALSSSTTPHHEQAAHSTTKGNIHRTSVSMTQTTGSQKWNYLKGLLRSLEPVTMILLFEGLFICFYSYRKRDKLVLVFVAFGFLLAIWIRLSQIGSLNSRYFFPVYFLLVPFVAIGFLWSFKIFVKFGQRLFLSAPLQIVPAVGLSLILTCVYLVDALDADHRQREAEQSFGIWIKEHYGPLNSVVANRGALRVGYYASGLQPVLSDVMASPEGFSKQQRPQLAILFMRDTTKDSQRLIQNKIDQKKWIRISQDELPESAAGFIVLVNPSSSARIVSKAGIPSIEGNTKKQ